MSIDQQPLGAVVAEVMDDLAAASERGELGHNPRIVRCLVVVEVISEDSEGDGRLSTSSCRMTDGSSTIGLGLIERARETLLRPTGDLSG